MSTNNDITNQSAGNGEGSAPAETPPQAVSTAKVFTQEEVNRIAANAREDGRKSALKTPTATPAIATPAPAPQAPASEAEQERVTLKQLKERLDESEMRRAFDKRAAKRGLDEPIADELFEIFKVQRPSDTDDWFEKKSALFGFKPPGTPAAPTAATPPAPATPAAPVPVPATAPNAPSGPVNPVATGGLIDLFQLSHTQLAQMGPSGVRAELDKIRAFSHQSSGLARMPKAPERK